MMLPEYIRQRYWLKSYHRGLPAEIPIPDLSVGQLVELGMSRDPSRAAMVYLGTEITYRQMQMQINHFAALLSRWGVKKGETVAVLLPNCPQFAIAYYAALRIGAMVTALSPLFMPPEIQFQLSDSNARTLVVEQSLWPKVEPVIGTLDDLKEVVLVNLRPGKSAEPPRADGLFLFGDLFKGEPMTPPVVPINPEEDVATLQYTGGTTGLPKAAMLTHRNIVADIVQIGCYLDTVAAIDGVSHPTIVSVLPWYHIYAQTVDLSTILCRGGTVVTLPTFDVDRVLRMVQENRAQVLMGISSMFLAFLNHPGLAGYDLSSLIWCNNGATRIAPETVKAFEDVTGVRIVEGYGLSEASPVTHTTSPYMERRIGSVGPPLPNTLQGIIDPETCEFLPPGTAGELIVHGPQVMKGYWKRPQETADVFLDIEGQTWLRTGDLGVLDEDGYLIFLSRSKDLIKYKGHSVYSTEIEQVLHHHPAVDHAAVIGIPDRVAGELIKAFVVLKKEFRDRITEKEILSWARTMLAGYKHPRILEFRDEFPGSLFGKVLRRVLREEELRKQETAEAEEIFA